MNSFVQKLEDQVNFSQLPYDVNIQSLNVYGKLDTTFDLNSIEHYFKDFPFMEIKRPKYYDRVSIKFKRKTSKTNKKQEKKELSDIEQEYITKNLSNVKLFRNGSYWISGKNFKGIYTAVNFISNKLARMSSNPENVNVDKFCDVKIKIENSVVDYRKKLNKYDISSWLLYEGEIPEYDYYSTGIPIKKDTDTIRIFESGKVVMSGNITNCERIKFLRNYVMDLLERFSLIRNAEDYLEEILNRHIIKLNSEEKILDCMYDCFT